MKDEIDNQKLSDKLNFSKQFEASMLDYLFISPKNKQDFLDEAEMQQNCLASYVKKVANGECLIMFMRNKATPEESLVTIELRKGKLGQRYQARNESVTSEQATVINKWYNEVVANKY